jgi:uncharacterized circularly permuted ATP-grasp superfamily protein/uncharacterized alpha-E superfamily protein
VSEAVPLDEMVDGASGVRPHWRWLLGGLAALGHEALAERAAELDRIFADADDGALAIGGSAASHWRCDPIPLLLPVAEFDDLTAGLVQRARLLDAILQDVYGSQRLLSDGLLPPALVFGNPAFLRSCRMVAGREAGLLHLYAADLLRAPDGRWHVIADRTAGAGGVAHVPENRRILVRHLPELGRIRELRRPQAFFDLWQDGLQCLAGSGAANPGVALLSEGQVNPAWIEHVLLARALSCALVEPGDLSVRDGVLYLKTLRGLQRVDVLLRCLDGRRIDPLEPGQSPQHGVAGLLQAMRNGAVRMVNDPGAGFAEAPGLAAFLPRLAERILGEPLRVPGVQTFWLGETAGRTLLEASPERWLVRHAVDGTVPSVVLAALEESERQRLLQRLATAPDNYAIAERLPASLAPSARPGVVGLEPVPVILRLFLIFDGRQWHAMQGGLGRVLGPPDPRTGRRGALRRTKDVWITADETSELQSPSLSRVTAVPVRRGSADLPSRVAENFFWLGRYLERLEGAARLLRAAATRLLQPAPSPRELTELASLSGCLVRADLLDDELVQGQSGLLSGGALAHALLRAARENGPLFGLLGQVSRLADGLRDRLTSEVHLALQRGLREIAERLRAVPGSAEKRSVEALAEAAATVLGFAATLAGLAAENMVRGGGRLFLDLGRRVERGQAICAELARLLFEPGAASQPARLEPGLRLALELRDSVITYRSRYLTALQAGPVLDLVLADESNPRGLAFQLVAARDMIAELEGVAESPLAISAADLLAEVQTMVREVVEAAVQAEAASHLAPRLVAMTGAIAELSDRIARRWFALLPAPYALGTPVAIRLRGAA